MAETKKAKKTAKTGGDAESKADAPAADAGPTGGPPTGGAPTKFAEFVKSSKLDPRRILIASRKLETLQPEDRIIKHNKRKAKAGGEGAEAAPKETRKPRSGRPVTGRAIAAALSGKKLSGPTKTRILRAINHLLEQKKQTAIDLRPLF